MSNRDAPRSPADRTLVYLFLLALAGPALATAWPKPHHAGSTRMRMEIDPVAGVLLVEPTSAPTPREPRAPKKIKPPKHQRKLVKLMRSLLQPISDKLAEVGPLLHRGKVAAAQMQQQYAHGLSGRAVLTSLHSNLEVRLFQRSPVSQVVVGREGWLFYTGHASMDGYRGVAPFTEEELATLRRKLLQRQEEAVAAGAVFLLVLIPDKQTVYADQLPARFTRVGPSRLAQVAADLRRHPGLSFIDTSEPLRAAEGPVYAKTDTHWDSAGAFIAYRAVAERLQEHFPALHPAPAEAYEWQAHPADAGDLAKMMKLGPAAGEIRHTLVPRASRLVRTEKPPGYLDRAFDGPLAFTAAAKGEIPCAVVFHDSFGAALAPFLAQHFQRTVFAWSGVPVPALYEQEHPQVVLWEIVERNLAGHTGRQAASARPGDPQ